MFVVFYCIYFLLFVIHFILKDHLSHIGGKLRAQLFYFILFYFILFYSIPFSWNLFFFPCSSRLEPSVSNQSTPQGSGTATPDSHSAIDTLSEQDEGTLTPSSKQTTPTTSPNSFVR